MFPVKDDIPTDRVPLVTLALIAAVVAGALVTDAGLLPVAVAVLFLWLFGPSVEDALGRPRFVVFVVAGGLLAAGVQRAVDPDATLTLAAATGAIAAAIGAYLRLYPWGHILCLVVLPFFFTIVEVPVVVLVAVWIGLQVVVAIVDPGDVAYAGQLAGFAFGALVAALLAVNAKARDRAVLS